MAIDPSSPLMDYNPSFNQPIKGNYQDDTHFCALNIGSDAYVTEREWNESQWLQIENVAELIRQMTYSGVTTVSDKNNINRCFDIVNNDTNHLNGFELPPFTTICNGFITHHETYKKTNETKKNISIRLPNPPVMNTRHDFVYVEFWFKELKKHDDVPKYGGLYNDSLSYNIIDERIQAETSRRIQLQWTVSHYEDYHNKCVNGFLDADGNPNPDIHPWEQTSFRAVNFYYRQSKKDPYLFVAGNGTPHDKSQLHTADGFVYAIPLFNILRLNNSGYNAQHNPYGGIDWVNEDTVSDRPDGKFTNIIYLDQIQDLRHLATLSAQQYTKIYTTLQEYYTDSTILKNKLLNITQDLKNVNNILNNAGYDLPSLYDKEVYGIEMYHQYAETCGAVLSEDEFGEAQIMRYRKHRKYYISDKLSKMDYGIILTNIDYSWDEKGKIGDVWVDKRPNWFRIYNTGAQDIRLNTEAIQIDNISVFGGKGVFKGMDGAFIDMPFKLNTDRYFVYILPLTNENGRNGEIFCKFVEKQVIVYNTGLTTSKKGKVTGTTNNEFEYLIIDLYSVHWKNMNHVNITLSSETGVAVSSAELGDRYRLSLGTPILSTADGVETGSVGDIYADVDEDDTFTVYNTGSAGATLQCLIFNDVPFKDYYDTIKIPIDISVPKVVVSEE